MAEPLLVDSAGVRRWRVISSSPHAARMGRRDPGKKQFISRKGPMSAGGPQTHRAPAINNLNKGEACESND
jgi:hypothetical protein